MLITYNGSASARGASRALNAPSQRSSHGPAIRSRRTRPWRKSRAAIFITIITSTERPRSLAARHRDETRERERRHRAPPRPAPKQNKHTRTVLGGHDVEAQCIGAISLIIRLCWSLCLTRGMPWGRRAHRSRSGVLTVRTLIAGPKRRTVLYGGRRDPVHPARNLLRVSAGREPLLPLLYQSNRDF